MKKTITTIEKHLLNDKKPSIFFNEISSEKQCNIHPLNLLFYLKCIPQSPKFHPEGNVWNHTMMVIDNAAKYKHQSHNEEEFMWSALLHDIGKIKTTAIKKDRITSYNHDIEGAKMVKEFLQHFVESEIFILNVSYLVRWHMQTLNTPPNKKNHTIKKMKMQVNIQDLHLLCLCDRLGRGNMNKQKIDNEIKSVKYFFDNI